MKGNNMKTYQGQRPADDTPGVGDCRVVVTEDGRTRPLYHVKYHSDAFEWGYGGSGPGDLSLSILADFFGERPTRKQIERGKSRAWRCHQPFKWAFISTADHSGFTITEEQITEWLKKQGGDDDDDNT
jgi:hypothetical protein